MKKVFVVALFMLGMVGAAGTSYAQQAPLPLPSAEDKSDRPIRNGFTLELGLGLSFSHVFPPGPGGSFTKAGLAPLSISLGGFLNNNWALLFRIAGHSYFSDDAVGDKVQTTAAFVGAHVQYWFNDWFMVSGGPGVVGFGTRNGFNQLGTDRGGFGVSLRAGFSFATWENHSLRFSLELFPAVLEGSTKIMGEAINFEWQWF